MQSISYEELVETSYGNLQLARDAAKKSQKYDSTVSRAKIQQLARNAFPGKEAYKWQVDTTEALSLGLDGVVLVPTGGGKTFLFILLCLANPTKQIVVVEGSLNAYSLR